ncbi:MAG: tRNA epoxyqueuosine(34) reductase QueG, partial [Duncaniella sp.]|nr:tRNA epoxyqueuosine(34) reductase QueG [Duncaniella sp.]
HDVRRYPRLLLNPVPSRAWIISAAFPYFNPLPPAAPLRWARYALGRDYHEELRERLSPVASWLTSLNPDTQARITVDTAPLRERYWAVRAGVGFIGLNGQLIVPGYGSWVLLAEIVTTQPLTPSAPCTLSCRGCMRCVRACPGSALDGSGALDARRCLSYLTIESRADVPTHPSGTDMRGLMGRRVYGCDTCQDVCPHNLQVPVSTIPAFAPRPGLLDLTAADILAMDQPAFSALMARSAIKRAKLAGLQRNARCTARPDSPRE